MYCVKCGCQLSDDANFCQRCGTRVQPIISDVVNSTETNGSSSELNRDALKIYLSDVLALECIKAKYAEKVSDSEYTLALLKKKIGTQKIQLTTKPNAWQWCHLRYDGKIIYIAHLGELKTWLADEKGGVYTKEVLEGCNWSWYEVDANMKYFKELLAWRQSTYPNTSVSSAFDLRYKREDIRDRFLKSYEEFKRNAPALYKKHTDAINSMETKIKGLKQELQKASQLLEKAYNVNIIPSHFRNNIYAIYYLNEYIKTSNESFSSALLHFDLEEIKAKLDTIIQQQREIIVQQAMISAQNKQLLQQNKMKLDQLCAIESNAARIAQYAEIAAHNSEISTWISFNNYLKA